MANPNIVSVTSIYAGNAGYNLSATTTATLLTVDADKIVKINNIICANVDAVLSFSRLWFVISSPKVSPPRVLSGFSFENIKKISALIC